MDKKPWETHPALSAERLMIVANILRTVRHDALPNHDPDKGDTNWGLGTRVSERSWFAIRNAAPTYDWLRIINSGKHFVFAIGGVPLRFYRGMAEKPSTKMLARRYPEILQHQTAFEFFQNETEFFWRFAIETDFLGEVLRIVVAQMSEGGDVKSIWEVPLTQRVSALTLITEKKPEGIELPPPIVTGKKGKLKLVKKREG